jgi:hypothetical protein
MSSYSYVPSVCGSSGSWVDIYDLEANPDGVVCCDLCDSIINLRQNWYQAYGVSI